MLSRWMLRYIEAFHILDWIITFDAKLRGKKLQVKNRKLGILPMDTEELIDRMAKAATYRVILVHAATLEHPVLAGGDQ
uniref:Uncharacterized protein n=1 Tax=Acrobeloides nanus TaxID=290746 RepID=A0A914D466_9BILA